MDSRGDSACRRSAATLDAAWAALLVTPSSRALVLGVQGRRVPQRRPLAPRPCHHLHRRFITTVDRPLLRRKRPRIITGSLSFLCSGKLSDGCHCCQQWSKEEEASKRGRDGQRGLPPSPFIAREGQPASPTIVGNDGFPCMSQGLVKSCSRQGSVGKRRRPRPINRHASTEAAGFWGPWCFELDPWLRREAKPARTLCPGANVGVLETGVPRLACLQPTA